MAYLEIDSLNVTYGDYVGVQNLNLNVEAGELLAVVGPSGSGKTTLLLAIAGFVPAAGGDIRRDGRSLGRVPPHLRDIGFVFQTFALFPHRSVAQNIGYPLTMRRWPRAAVAERVDELLRYVRLENMGGRFPDELSGGQQQRVALARAMAFRPQLLLMDEPLGALDKSLRDELQFEIRRIQKEQHLTVLYVTHDQNEAMAISDRVAVLAGGELVQVAPAREIYDKPLTPNIARFFGAANFLLGTIAAIDNSSLLVRVGSTTLVARAPQFGAAEVGHPVLMMFRANHARLSATDEEGGLKCIVRRTIFLGDYSLIHVDPVDGSVVTSGEYLKIRANPAHREPLPGSSASLCIDPSKTLLFPNVREVTR